VDAARQRLAQAGLVAAALLAGCGSSTKPPPRGGPTLRLALPILPRTLDPAKAGDMPSLNVTHELYAGLTRFSETGVKPDLAESWDVDRGGLVWTFHLRKNLRWSDERRLTAADLRRSWLRALAPATGAPLAGPDLGIVRGARAFHATGRGAVGVDAVDDHTLRVTLQHPIPWLDQLVAHPIASAYRPDAFSGPFRLAGRAVLERNFNYWKVRAVKPSRLVLTTTTKGADAILPRGLAPPGLPWVQTAKRPSGPGWKRLRTLAVQLLWKTDPERLPYVPSEATDLVPRAMPGFSEVVESRSSARLLPLPHGSLTVAYTVEDALAAEAVRSVRRDLAPDASVAPRRYASLAELVRATGPPGPTGADLVLLGWSSKIFDAYNTLDLFPCTSAFNISQFCDRSYDALMRQAVRTLDDHARWRIERQILAKLNEAEPAVPLSQPSEYVWLKPGVRGFSWSPIGFYELAGMTRS
jgi:ABC-type transport system substrate-binding protein